MKKEVIMVQQDKCPLDVLAEMGEQIRNSWIFLHGNAIKKLEKTASLIEKKKGYCILVYEKTEKYPETMLGVTKIDAWYLVQCIKAEDIAYNCRPFNPQDIFFLQMDV